MGAVNFVLLVLLFAAGLSTRHELRTGLAKTRCDVKEIKMKLKDFEEAFARVDEATTAIGTKLRELAEKVANGGMTAEEEAQVAERLQALAGTLETMGSDPTDPIPNPVPEDPATPTT
jgi:hypothetical protein